MMLLSLNTPWPRKASHLFQHPKVIAASCCTPTVCINVYEYTYIHVYEYAYINAQYALASQGVPLVSTPQGPIYIDIGICNIYLCMYLCRCI